MTTDEQPIPEPDRPQLSEVLPELADELTRLLRDTGESELANVIGCQRFHGWCCCTDDFCQSFRTAPEPNGPYGYGHRNIPLHPEQGMIVIDVVHDAVMYVEVLFRPEVPAAFRTRPSSAPLSRTREARLSRYTRP